MNINEITERINELYHKSQNEGLTEEEKNEQQALRTMFLQNVRNNLKSQLDNIDIKEKDGSITHLSDMRNTKND